MVNESLSVGLVLRDGMNYILRMQDLLEMMLMKLLMRMNYENERLAELFHS
jgi:hypothetical protein